jgi:hypothetical protein
LKEWLVNYKFKNWMRTDTRGLVVTPAMRKNRAATIARELNKTEQWHSHGRGISMQVLQQELRLQIDDLDHDSARSDLVKQYDRLLSDYMMKRQSMGVLHTVRRYLAFM